MQHPRPPIRLRPVCTSLRETCGAALAALLLWPAAAAPAELVPLYVIDLKITADKPPDLGRPLRVRLFSDAPSELARHLTGVVSVAADHVVLDTASAPITSSGAPAAAPVATFVVDYDPAPVTALREQLVSRYGATPTNADLVAFVRSTLVPSTNRGFDVASQVATRRTGDCTEHAVLLAALARSQHLPARVAVGTVLARAGDELGAFGHAWTEIYRDGRWDLVDATPIEGASVIAYIPEGVLEDEGPGYAFGMISLISTGILRVEVVGNAP